MSHVYMVYNSAKDIHVFERREHILPSVAISYCRCPGYSFTVKEGTGKDIHVSVTNAKGEEVTTIVAMCLPVWTEPSHL